MPINVYSTYGNRRIRIDFIDLGSVDAQGNGTLLFSINEQYNVTATITKTYDHIQNTAFVKISGLNEDNRNSLFSRFTMYNAKYARLNKKSAYVRMEIRAGYAATSTGDGLPLIFRGEVSACTLIEGLPNITLGVSAGTNQIDRSNWSNLSADVNSTVGSIAADFANQAGLTLTIDPDLKNRPVPNFPRQIPMSAVPKMLMRADAGNILAYIDDSELVIQKPGTNIRQNTSTLITPDDIVGIPSWTEFGINFTTFINNNIRLVTTVNVSSRINKYLDGEYLVAAITYEIAGRDKPFYMSITAYPPG